MSTSPGPHPIKQKRKNTLRIFYLLLVLATGSFALAVGLSQAAQVVLFAIGSAMAGVGIWSFLRFLKVADTHQRLINHEATSFAFVGSLLLTLAVGILQRFGCLSRATLLVPVLMIALWSIGLILFSWQYQE
jgi:hypothetical protein